MRLCVAWRQAYWNITVGSKLLRNVGKLAPHCTVSDFTGHKYYSQFRFPVKVKCTDVLKDSVTLPVWLHYWLHDQGIVVLFPVGTGYFTLLQNAEIGSPFLICIRDLFYPRVNRPGRDDDRCPPSNNAWSHTSASPHTFSSCTWTNLALHIDSYFHVSALN